ncbi:MAG: DUF309 domain-containing protein, partial [Staphylococcus epidermidis]|nr:DUF309 domain-containing protein [Staphylococcus epidermidis]
DRTEVIKNRERALFHRQYRNKSNKKDQ